MEASLNYRIQLLTGHRVLIVHVNIEFHHFTPSRLTHHDKEIFYFVL